MGRIDRAWVTSRRGAAGSLSSTGVLNSLYGAYNSGSYSTDFHDETVGYNTYNAGVGYDLVTGIGSPIAPAIDSLLAGTTSAGAGRPAAIIAGKVSAKFPNIFYSPGPGTTLIYGTMPGPSSAPARSEIGRPP